MSMSIPVTGKPTELNLHVKVIMYSLTDKDE